MEDAVRTHTGTGTGEKRSAVIDKRMGSDVDALASALRGEIPLEKSGNPIIAAELGGLYSFGWYHVTPKYIVVRLNPIISTIGILHRPTRNRNGYENAHICVQIV